MVLPVSTGTYRFSAGMPLMENGNYQFLLAPTVFPLACHSWKMVLPVSTGTYRFYKNDCVAVNHEWYVCMNGQIPQERNIYWQTVGASRNW